MPVRDVGAHGPALRANPRRARLLRAVEGDVLAGGVARRRDRERLQMAVGDQAGQPVELHQRFQQFGERFVVEQRVRARLAPARHGPAQRQQGEPVRAAAQHAERVGAVHLLGPKPAPDLGDVAHRVIEMVRATGQRRGVDGPRRGAAHDLEWAVLARQTAGDAQVGNRLQHSHLIGSAGTAARKNQRGAGSVRLLQGHVEGWRNEVRTWKVRSWGLVASATWPRVRHLRVAAGHVPWRKSTRFR